MANTLTAAAPIALVDHAGDGTRDRAGTANERKRRPSAFRNPVSAGKQRAPSRPPQPLARRDPRIEVVAAGHTGFLTARVRPGCAQIVPWDRAHEMVPEPVPRPPPWVRTGNSASASALPSGAHAGRRVGARICRPSGASSFPRIARLLMSGRWVASRCECRSAPRRGGARVGAIRGQGKPVRACSGRCEGPLFRLGWRCSPVNRARRCCVRVLLSRSEFRSVRSPFRFPSGERAAQPLAAAATSRRKRTRTS